MKRHDFMMGKFDTDSKVVESAEGFWVKHDDIKTLLIICKNVVNDARKRKIDELGTGNTTRTVTVNTNGVIDALKHELEKLGV